MSPRRPSSVPGRFAYPDAATQLPQPQAPQARREQPQTPIKLPRHVAEQAPQPPRARFQSSSAPQASPTEHQTKIAQLLARPELPLPVQEHGQRQPMPLLQFSLTTSQQSQHARDQLALQAIFPALGHVAACAMTQRARLVTRRVIGKGSSSSLSHCSSSAASWHLASFSQTRATRTRR